MSSVNFQSSTGVAIQLTPYPGNTTWNPKAGIYAFAHKDTNGWVIHYVGQTNSFADRIPSHERWEDARRAGATHVLAAVVATQGDRDKIESAMIRELQPRLNTQLR